MESPFFCKNCKLSRWIQKNHRHLNSEKIVVTLKLVQGRRIGVKTHKSCDSETSSEWQHYLVTLKLVQGRRIGVKTHKSCDSETSSEWQHYFVTLNLVQGRRIGVKMHWTSPQWRLRPAYWVLFTLKIVIFSLSFPFCLTISDFASIFM